MKQKFTLFLLCVGSVLLVGCNTSVEKNVVQLPEENKQDQSGESIVVSENQVAIDVQRCAASIETVAAGFGSTTIQVIGNQEGNTCVVEYWGEIENSQTNSETKNECRFPDDLRSVILEKNNNGVDFSSVSEFCKQV